MMKLLTNAGKQTLSSLRWQATFRMRTAVFGWLLRIVNVANIRKFFPSCGFYPF